MHFLLTRFQRPSKSGARQRSPVLWRHRAGSGRLHRASFSPEIRYTLVGDAAGKGTGTGRSPSGSSGHQLRFFTASRPSN